VASERVQGRVGRLSNAYEATAAPGAPSPLSLMCIPFSPTESDEGPTTIEDLFAPWSRP